MKQSNRREEVLLINAEKFSSFASLSNREYPAGELSDAWKRGYEVNAPLLAVPATRHSGSLPSTNAFCTLGPDRLILTSIKKAEDSGAWIIQWYNTGNATEEAILQLPKTPKRVMRVNFLEDEIGPVAIEGRRFKVTTKPHAVETIEVEF